MTDEPKITYEEMAELFGGSIPMDALMILTSTPPGWSIAQVRAQIRVLAKEVAGYEIPPSGWDTLENVR